MDDDCNLHEDLGSRGRCLTDHERATLTPGLQLGERRVPARPPCAIPWPLPPPLRFQPEAGRSGPGAVEGMGTGPACATPTLAKPLVARLCVAVPSAPLARVAARLPHAAPDTSCVGVGWGRRPRGPARSSAGPEMNDLPSTYIRSASEAPVLQYVDVTVTTRTSDTVCRRADAIVPPLAPAGPR